MQNRFDCTEVVTLGSVGMGKEAEEITPSFLPSSAASVFLFQRL